MSWPAWSAAFSRCSPVVAPVSGALSLLQPTSATVAAKPKATSNLFILIFPFFVMPVAWAEFILAEKIFKNRSKIVDLV